MDRLDNKCCFSSHQKERYYINFYHKTAIWRVLFTAIYHNWLMLLIQYTKPIKTRIDVYETLCPQQMQYIKVAKLRTARPLSPVQQVRRAPDHFFGRIYYPPYQFFAVSAASVVITCDSIPSNHPKCHVLLIATTCVNDNLYHIRTSWLMSSIDIAKV